MNKETVLANLPKYERHALSTRLKQLLAQKNQLRTTIAEAERTLAYSKLCLTSVERDIKEIEALKVTPEFIAEKKRKKN